MWKWFRRIVSDDIILQTTREEDKLNSLETISLGMEKEVGMNLDEWLW